MDRLACGDTLILYTGGLLEAGEVTNHISSEQLAERLEHSSGSSVQELTEKLRADTLRRCDGRLQDDLVLVALRPHPEPSIASRGPFVSSPG